MNILFLDIDGVLNSFDFFMTPDSDWFPGKYQIPFPLCDFDPNAIKVLNDIIEQCNIDQIVISSDWRNNWSLEELTNIFSQVQIKIPTKLDRTKCLINEFSSIEYEKIGRGYEIDCWLKEHIIDNYIILDDDDRFLDYQKSHLVLTNYNIGLQKKHVELSNKIINK